MTVDNQTLMLLNAYHDGELSPGEALAMQRRIESEPELAMVAQSLKQLSSSLVDVMPGEPASERLRATVLASLSLELTGDGYSAKSDRREGNAPSSSANTRGAVPWRSIAASLAMGIVSGGLGGYALHHLTDSQKQVSLVENEILAAHLRGLLAPQPFDIASSQSHVVKPWFNGKTTIAPTAPDFAAQGFPLVGGRVDFIGGQAVPTLVFMRRQHTISVTVTTSDRIETSLSSVADGTNMRRWTSGDLTYWAVSDLNPAELSSFTELYQRALSAAQ